MSAPTAPAVSYDEACHFIITLGRAAHAYGSTGARIELFLSRVATALGCRAVVRSTPTEMLFAFQPAEGQPQQLQLIAMPGTGLDLAKLDRLGDVASGVEAGTLSVSEARAQMDQIAKMPAPWGRLAIALGYASVGAGIAVLLSGSWADLLCGTLLSLLVYALVLLSARGEQRSAEWLPLTSAFAVAVLASAARLLLPELNVVLVVLVSIVVLLPGYTISLGVIELVGGHVTSGSANLMSGLVYLAKQIAGAWLGVALAAQLLALPAASAGVAVASHWLWLFMPPLLVGLCVIFQTPPRNFAAAVFGCAVAYAGILLGSALVGGNLGNLIGTVVAVVFANVWARKTLRPTSIVLLPAIILLVSGSIGFRGLVAVTQGDVAGGEQQFLQMFVVALTIAAGLLLGNTLVKPKATL